MLNEVNDRDQLQEALNEHKEYCVLAFWGRFSDASERALAELKQFADDYRKIPIHTIEVQDVKGIHKEYAVSSVPTVIVLKNGKEADRFTGAESAAFYALHLAGMAPIHVARPRKRKTPRVTVYTSPGCPPCSLVKTYLRENGIPFTSIDISRDAHAAREIVRRSGKQAVPQIDVNGRIVVGFDRPKLSSLLGIRHK